MADRVYAVKEKAWAMVWEYLWSKQHVPTEIWPILEELRQPGAVVGPVTPQENPEQEKGGGEGLPDK